MSRRICQAVFALAAMSLLAACATPKAVDVAAVPAVRPSERPAERAPDRPAERPSEPAPAPVAATPAATPAAPVLPPIGPVSVPLNLPGWEKEDHLAAFRAWQAGCPAAKDRATIALCRQSKSLVLLDGETARRFFELNFRVEAVGGEGTLTAYFAPRYEARDAPDGEFRAAVLPRPADLRNGQTYADRAEIEARPPNNVLAWMRPEDLFFLQIQGSGVLVFPDGRQMKAAFAAHNSRPFSGIATPMRQRGLLAANNTSGDAIRGWLAEHRGPEANEIMRLNARYVFFTLAPDDGLEPVGAAGIPLPSGHAIAVDPASQAYGELFWIDAAAPVLSGAFPVYQRLVVALDTGGAIRGEVRADLYLGSGDEAGREAGRVRHALRMFRLVPKEP